MTSDELLNANLLSLEDDLPDDNTIKLDGELRIISIPQRIKNFGVASDDNVKRVRFSIPRYCTDTDLSEFSVFVNYQNAIGEGDRYTVLDQTYDDEHIYFSWLIGRYALKEPGDLQFAVCLKKFRESEIIKEFNSTIATIPVIEGLETTEAIIDNNPDVLDLLLASAGLTEFNKHVDRAIDAKVDAYLATIGLYRDTEGFLCERDD